MKRKGRTIIQDLKMIYFGIKEFDAFLPKQLRNVAINAALSSAIPYIGLLMTSCIINELTGAKRIKFLVVYIGFFILITFVSNVILAVIQKKIQVGYNQLFPAHEIRLNEKANRMPYYLLENEKVRELRDQVSGSIDCSGAGMGSLYWDMEIIFKSICSFLIGILILVSNLTMSFTTENNGIYKFINSYTSIIVLIILIVLSICISSKMTSKVFDVMFEVFKYGATYNRYANYYKLEYLSDNKSAKDVRLYEQEKLIVTEVLDKCYIPFRDGDKREKDASTKYNSIKLVVSAITGGFVYLIIGYKAISGEIGLGNVVLVYSAVTMLIQAFADFSMIFTDLRNNNEHLERYFKYVKMDEVGTTEEKINVSEEEYKISINDVSFKYPGENVYALKNISITIENGKKIAIVGTNGSGKTTLIKLLCGLYTPTQGTIFINDYKIDAESDMRVVNLSSVVFQDYKLLALSIGKNIAVSDEIDDAKVWNVLEYIGLKEKVMMLDKGIEQAIYQDYDEEGVSLSGGEEQKIAIARAVYKAAPILILDEPTAALDPISEYEIYTKLNQISNNKTTIFISHRLYSCRFCDEIIVLDKGKVVQRGKHDDLVKVEGKYSEMWNAQAQHYMS